MLLKLKLAAAALAAVILTGNALAAEPLRVGATFMASGLDPTKGSNGWAMTSHGIGENLFTVDAAGKLVPELAQSAERVDGLNWIVKLQPGRKFSDGSPVDAESVGKGLARTIEVSATARSTGGKLIFAAIDPLTLKVTTERPVAVLQALFAEWPMVVYRLKDDGSAIFSGPYAVKAFAPDQTLTLTANPNYPGADKRSDVVLHKFGDAQAMALAFEAGSLDLAFGLPSESIARLRTKPGLTVKGFPVGYQYMAWFNTRHPQIADSKVRAAIDLAFDRVQLAAAINSGRPATGAYAPYFDFAPKQPRAFDLPRAKALLEEAGWKAGAGGMRAKDGTPLKVVVAAYPQRPDLVSMLPVVKAQLKAAGIEAETKVVENASQSAAAGDFDLFLWAQHTAPSGDPAFFLNSMVRSGASLNYSGYASPAFDAILDRLAGETAPDKRIALAQEAQSRLFADAPVSFLISPEWFVGTSARLAGYEPWGSDYHVLRANIGEKP